MIRPEDTALVLLAAGRSARFGTAGSKLDQLFLGSPLGLHAAAALAAVPFGRRIAVVSPTCPLDYAAHDFDVVVNGGAAEGMGSSVRVGTAAAREHGAAAVLIALADMPRITAAHVRRLFDAADEEHAVVASRDGEKPTPPALFGSAHFDALLHLTGDQGARFLIARGRHVAAGADELVDVDTPGDLERLRRLARTRD